MSPNADADTERDAGSHTTGESHADGVMHGGSHTTAADWETYANLAEEDPLAHPLAFSLTLDYPYLPPPALRELYEALFRAVSADYHRASKQLVRLLPRDHGKSEVGSVVFPSWKSLANPNSRTLIMMHKEKKASGKLRQCRDIIESHTDEFDVSIERSNNTELTLARSENHDVPTIEAAGFESGVTGGHYDNIVVDDGVIWDTQNTEGKREKAKSKFQNYMNLGDEGDTTYLVLGTRKHKDDLYSWLLSKPEWESKVYQAISDRSVIENGEFTLVTDAGNDYPANARGTIPPNEALVDVRPHRDVPVLWPDRYDLSDLIFEYLSAGSATDDGDGVGSSAEWLREKMNIPSALSGELLAEEMLGFEQSLPAGTRPGELVNFVSLDLGIEKDPQKAAANDTDYWALSVLSYAPQADTAFLRDVSRRRGMSVQQAVEWVARELRPYDYGTVHVESVQAQSFFAQALADAGVPSTEVTPDRAKEERIVALSSQFENGSVRILGKPTESKWDSFVEEWVEYPSGSHDDRLDSVAIAVKALNDWKNRNGGGRFHFG